jgi:hypothetical protein
VVARSVSPLDIEIAQVAVEALELSERESAVAIRVCVVKGVDGLASGGDANPLERGEELVLVDGAVAVEIARCKGAAHRKVWLDGGGCLEGQKHRAHRATVCCRDEGNLVAHSIDGACEVQLGVRDLLGGRPRAAAHRAHRQA